MHSYGQDAVCGLEFGICYYFSLGKFLDQERQLSGGSTLDLEGTAKMKSYLRWKLLAHSQMRGCLPGLSPGLSVYCACANRHPLDSCGLMGEYERVLCLLLAGLCTLSVSVFLYADFRSPSSAPVGGCSEQLGGTFQAAPHMLPAQSTPK